MLDGPHRRGPGEPRGLESRSVRRRARLRPGRRRGVGTRRHRHAQHHVVDGGRLPPARTRGFPAARRPHLLRRCRRGVGQRARRPVDGRPRARRHPGRLRAHRERGTSLGAERGSLCRGERGREGRGVATVARAGNAGPRIRTLPQRQCAGEGRGGRAAARRVSPCSEVPRALARTSRDAGSGRRARRDAARSRAGRRGARCDAEPGRGGVTSMHVRTPRSRRTSAVAPGRRT